MSWKESKVRLLPPVPHTNPADRKPDIQDLFLLASQATAVRNAPISEQGHSSATIVNPHGVPNPLPLSPHLPLHPVKFEASVINPQGINPQAPSSSCGSPMSVHFGGSGGVDSAMMPPPPPPPSRPPASPGVSSTSGEDPMCSQTSTQISDMMMTNASLGKPLEFRDPYFIFAILRPF